MNCIRLRQTFVDYFRKNGHKFLPPSKVYTDDPTLFFTTAGMVQLKNTFLGKEERPFKRLTNSQICVRAGGKHNDLDDVGFDSSHLTTFEMLSSWHLCVDDKETAIKLAINFLEELGLDKNRMYITYFKGNEHIKEDTETKEICDKYLPNRVVSGSYEDNFWSMADDEIPCGPCTEIHYDLIGDRDAKHLVNNNDPTVLELWNNVFVEYYKSGNTYTKLNKLYIDTGMGLERLAMVLNNEKTIYQTDAFRYLIAYAQILSNNTYFHDSYNNSHNHYHIDVAYRIFADHMRTVINALFDGVEFDCNKRGFILRKIFRRAMTYYYVYLNNGIVESTMNKSIIKCMISDILNYFLKMKHDADYIQSILIKEEQQYVGILANTKKSYDKLIQKNTPFDKILDKLKNNKGIDELFITHIDKMKFRHFNEKKKTTRD